MNRRTLFLIPLLLAVFVLPAVAQQVDKLQDALQMEQKRADEREAEINRLSKKEQALSGKLSDIEARVKKVQRTVRKQERTLKDIQARKAETRNQYLELEARRDATTRDLQGLLRTLWPIHVQNVRSRLGDVSSWGEADRRFVWLADIYHETRRTLETVRKQSDELAAVLEKEQRLEKEQEAQLDKVNAAKDDLLRGKLALGAALRKVSSERKDTEQELQDVLSTIQDLNYQLNSLKTRNFASHKRTLPWPVSGSLEYSFAPNADPPRRGLSMATLEGDPVRTVFWGKVVHSDTLRGFGQVVIVYHGHNYYSLYAFLSKSLVQTGQEVEKDEVIGETGYYPLLKGPGLYFELRFRQKPINPKQWLISLQ